VKPKYLPPLKPLHPETSLSPVKLAKYGLVSTEVLIASLAVGEEGCLKTRPDGTILDGHHRIHILRTRGINVDKLPRDIVVRGQK
jgi:hypothetical protein